MGPKPTAVIHIVHIRIHTGRPHIPGRKLDTPSGCPFSSRHIHFIFLQRRGGGVDGSPDSVDVIEVENPQEFVLLLSDINSFHRCTP